MSQVITTINAPLKWHGGKSYLAKRIVELMPPRVKNPNAPAKEDPGFVHYVEPYFGGGQVLFANDPDGISEVANDLNCELTNFWKVLQDVQAFQSFQRLVEATPFSEQEFQMPTPEWLTTVERAVRFFVRCRQSLAGRMKGFTGVTKTRARRGMNNEVSAWLTAIEGLPAVHERLKRVLILNRPALEVIKKHDGPQTLYYLDPPYVHSSRVTIGEYAHEMTDTDHVALLSQLAEISGRFLLSGYHTSLYDDFAMSHNWRVVEILVDNKASSKKVKSMKTECIWMNFNGPPEYTRLQ